MSMCCCMLSQSMLIDSDNQTQTRNQNLKICGISKSQKLVRISGAVSVCIHKASSLDTLQIISFVS